MKRINKKEEKGQRVRVLKTGELGTVTDRQLIPRGGRLHRYVQVRLDGRPHLDRWFWDDQLVPVVVQQTYNLKLVEDKEERVVDRFSVKVDYEKRSMTFFDSHDVVIDDERQALKAVLRELVNERPELWRPLSFVP